jgi:starch synthase
MKIVFAAAECTPYIKVGGLADVVGTLPPILTKLGHPTTVIIPHHGPVKVAQQDIKKVSELEIAWMGSTTTLEISHVKKDDVDTYLIRGWPYISGHEDFVYHHNEGVNVGRFLFFCYAALEWVRELARSQDWKPDILHLNDWHTAMVPYLLKQVYANDPVLGKTATLFTIHNMQYQGWGLGWHLDQAGFPPVKNSLLHATNKVDCSLAVGLAYSTMLNTVSPQYAQEIINTDEAYGLDGLLQARQSRLSGILNGIDNDRWNPATSTVISAQYDASQLDKKIENKLALQAELDLPQRPEVPVFGTVMRLVDQKGPVIMLPAVHYMLAHSDVQFVLLGTGEDRYEQEAQKLNDLYPNKASINLVFDEGLAERMYAGLDACLIPSLFEPCGIVQMIAMRFGTLPIARAVGGLVDTVTSDNGFLFVEYHPGALGWAMGQALDVFANDPAAWRERQHNAMQRDFSWENSARQYVELYQRTVNVHQQYV